MIRILRLAILVIAASPIVLADSMTFSGIITQSTSDGTGPATNNQSLNAINDGDSYLLTFNFAGAITGPGTYNMAGSTLLFNDATAGAAESAFNSISLTITQSGGFDQFSMLACLASGSGCADGNQLDLDFEIPIAGLNSQNVAATGLDQPHPLDLLEDDSTTDIHASVTAYSYTSVSSVPEPGSFLLLGSGLFALRLKRFRN